MDPQIGSDTAVTAFDHLLIIAWLIGPTNLKAAALMVLDTKYVCTCEPRNATERSTCLLQQ